MSKIEQFIENRLQQQFAKLGTGAYKDVAEPGQIALEGQMVVAEDVRVADGMKKDEYDTDRDGIVDDAKEVDGFTPADLLNRANHTGEQQASTIANYHYEQLLYAYIF